MEPVSLSLAYSSPKERANLIGDSLLESFLGLHCPKVGILTLNSKNKQNNKRPKPRHPSSFLVLLLLASAGCARTPHSRAVNITGYTLLLLPLFRNPGQGDQATHLELDVGAMRCGFSHFRADLGGLTWLQIQ